jgi:hypothetical protein
MGSSTRATCQCGYHASILIGGGRQDFKTTCYFPSLCEACQAIVQANLFARPVRCPQCLGAVMPYDNPSLTDSTGEGVIEEWNTLDELGRSLKLTDGNYKCPKCRHFTLKFRSGENCWD